MIYSLFMMTDMRALHVEKGVELIGVSLYEGGIAPRIRQAHLLINHQVLNNDTAAIEVGDFRKLLAVRSHKVLDGGIVGLD